MEASNRDQLDWRETRIEILNITGRAYNALLRAKIITIGQADNLSHEMLLHLNGIGTISVTEIETELRYYIASPHSYPVWGHPLANKESLPLFANTPLSILNISKYAHDALVSAGIETVNRLAELTDVHLKKITNAKHLGNMPLEEIKRKLANYLDDQYASKPKPATTTPTSTQHPTNSNQIDLSARFENTPISSLNSSFETEQFLSDLGFYTIGQLYTPSQSQLSVISQMNEHQRVALREQFLSFLHDARTNKDPNYANILLTTNQPQVEINVPPHSHTDTQNNQHNEHNEHEQNAMDEKAEHPPLDISIEDIRLFSKRTKNVLIRNGILTLRILMWHTSDMLRFQIRNLGDVRMIEIKDILTQWGWNLAETAHVRKVLLADLLIRSFYNIEHPLRLPFLTNKINQRNRSGLYSESDVAQMADWHPYIETIEDGRYQFKLRTIDLPPHSLSLNEPDVLPPPLSQKLPDSLPLSPSQQSTSSPDYPPRNLAPQGQIDLSSLWAGWISSLGEQQKNILFWHYGTTGDTPLTFAEVGKKINLSRERVRQIEVGSFKALRSPNKKSFWQPLQELINNGIKAGDGLLHLDEWEQLLDKHALWSDEDVRPSLLPFLSSLLKGYTHLDYYQVATYSHITAAHIRELDKILKKILQEHKQTGLEIQGLASAIPHGKFPEIMYEQGFLARATELFERVGLEEDGRYHYARKNKKSVRPTIDSGWAGEPGTRLHEWELKLRSQFKKIAWIGQLPFNENEFHELCQAIQEEAVEPHYFTKERGGQPRLVPPVVFMTSMVFSARYTEHLAAEDVDEFWNPYLRDVWGVSYTQAFMARCRKRFKQVAPYLEKTFDFVFPRQRAGDVVRPVYRHALIPRYMQADFADWLRKNWRDILETAESPSLLASQLKNDKSLELYYSHRLNQFITGKTTSETAVALITNMAAAISLHINDGESIENIHSLLAGTPIEQELWQELAQIFTNRTQKEDTLSLRQSKPRLTWLWSLDDEEMHLRVQNIILSTDRETEGDADRIVWLTDDEDDPLIAEIEEEVSPWLMNTGEQIVNDVFLTEPDAPLDGQLILLTDMDEEAIRISNIPPFPSQDVQFFRITQQGSYGVPVDHSQVNDGTWLICGEKPLLFFDETDQQIALDGEFSVPYPLNEWYQWAAQITFTLPITATQEGKNVLALAAHHEQSTIGMPTIVGGQPIQGLSGIVAPVFGTTQLSLIFECDGKHLLNQAIVWLSDQNGERKQWSVAELQERSIAKISENQLIITFAELLSDVPNIYTLNLRLSLTPILPSPVQFAIVPNLQAEPPDSGQIYTPANPPQVTLRGVDEAVIVRRKGIKIEAVSNDSQHITWTTLKRKPHLLLRFDTVDIPLAWDIPQITAWLEPTQSKPFFTMGEIQKTTLHVKSTHTAVTDFRLFVQGERYRTFSLKNGRYTQQIGQTQLYEMVRHADSQHITLKIQAGDGTWTLFEIRQRPQLVHVNTVYNAKKKTLSFTTGLKQEWAGDCHFMAESLTNPFASIIDLGHSPKLQKTHTFPANLPDGIYLLRLELENNRLPLPETAVQFTIGQADEELAHESQLVQEIRSGHLISRHLGEDFVLWWAELAEREDTELTPQTLLQLATISANALENFGISHLQNLWMPLTALKSVRDKAAWQQEHGLLPGWILLAHPIILKTARYSLKVHPIQLLDGGLTGIGYGRWKLSTNADAPKTSVYVQWKPISSTSHSMVHVEAGIPEDVPDQDWTAVDLLDCYGLHYCMRCGRLTGAKSFSLPDELIQEHLHGQATADLLDITIPEDVDDYQLEAEFLPQRRGHFLLDIYDKFDIHIPLAEKYLPEPTMPSQNPLERLESQGVWLGLIREIKRMGTNNPQYPFWSSATRLLSVWHNQKRVSDLGKITVAFSLLLRSAAVQQKQFRKLLKDANLSEKDCKELLSLLNNDAPNHLQWGLTWAELLIMHSPQRS